MRAMVQLPSYLERVLAGGRDLALVLLPLLNDLRAVRGSALLSEGTLLLLNLKSDQQAQPQLVHEGEQPMTVEQWARRLRARYQVGLIGWIRGERLEQNLDILAAVARKLEQIATRQPVFQLWWVVGAVIEALRRTASRAASRSSGCWAWRIARSGACTSRARRATRRPRRSSCSTIFSITSARAESTGARVSAVRASFRLTELLPVDESIEQERENLSAPVGQAHADRGRGDPRGPRQGQGRPRHLRAPRRRPAEELAPQVELLRKIGDTLGVLGLGELRARRAGRDRAPAARSSPGSSRPTRPRWWRSPPP